MGFININGHNVHTSSISGIGLTGSTITTSSGYFGLTGSTITTGTITTSSGYYTANAIGYKSSYNLMGEDIEVNGYQDPHVAHLIASINVLGWKYYEEFKKQHIDISDSLLTILEKRYKSYQREQKIDNIIG